MLAHKDLPLQSKMQRKEQIQKWLEEKPEDSFLLYALATEYIAEGNDKEAESIFKNLIKNDPEYYATYYHLGQLQERNGEDDLAIETYKKGMEICDKIGNKHAFGELRSVLEELEF